jgi:hypothetical protein
MVGARRGQLAEGETTVLAAAERPSYGFRVRPLRGLRVQALRALRVPTASSQVDAGIDPYAETRVRGPPQAGQAGGRCARTLRPGHALALSVQRATYSASRMFPPPTPLWSGGGDLTLRPHHVVAPSV